MKRTAVLVLVGVIAMVALFVAGCKDNDRTMISSILERPDKYVDRNVYIGGEVTRTYSVDLVIAEAGAYQLDDGSGKIWVITRTGVPREGAKVGLKGRVDSGIKIGREVFGAVVREEERRTK